MDYFKTVYRILNFLKKSEENEEFDDEDFTAGYFKLTERQWALTLTRLVRDGYISGVSLKIGADGYIVVSLSAPMITSSGMEYLSENTAVRKAARLLKGIKEVVS